MARPMRTLLILSVLLVAACTSSHAPLTGEGVAATEVTDDSVIIWSRGTTRGSMQVTVTDADGFTATGMTPLVAASDFTGQVTVDNLHPATNYEYRVRLTSAGARPADMQGQFRTAAAANQATPVSFAFGADLAGQNVCRDAATGFPIFSAIEPLELDFFVGLGDMIYADDLCDATGALGNTQIAGSFGRSESTADFHAHWRYTLNDTGMRKLRARTAYYAVWDDHEVVNDFGPGNDRHTPDGPALMMPGLEAFRHYNPVRSESHDRLYRRFRQGAHAELFLLDTRRYRDHNEQPDTLANPKSLLGATQAQWLIDSVTGSDATWKFVVSSVPLSLPTGWPREKGRDGWANDDGATGFEIELLSLLRAFQQANVRNLVWLSADVHFATGFEYTPFADDAGFRVLEFVAGPLNAGLFPTRELDRTLQPRRLYFHGPEAVGSTQSFDEATGWFNLGHISIEESGGLRLSIINGFGEVVQELDLMPAAEEGV